MTNQDMSSLHEETIESEKKLRKRERRLNEKLQQALSEREEALERLRRAEMRVQKRVARVQRLEARLTLVHQQLAAITAASATTATSIAPPPPPIETEQQEHAVDETALASQATTSAEPSPPTRSPREERVTAREDEEQREDELTQLLDVVEITGERLPEETLSVNEAFAPPHILPSASTAAEVIPSEDFQESTTSAMEAAEETVVSVDEGTSAMQARAAAEAAERAARLAAERAAQALRSLEQVQVSGGEVHHLLQEANQLQEEAERLSVLAQEKVHIARAVEQRLQSTPSSSLAEMQGPDREREDEDIERLEEDEEDDVEEEDDILEIDEEDEDEEREDVVEPLERDELEHAPPVLIADFDMPAPQLLNEYERAMMESPRCYAPHPRHIGLWPTQQQTDTSSVVPPAAIEQIEEEEEVKTVTPLLMAEAEAEAQAAEGMAFAAEAHSDEIEQSQVLRSTLFNDLNAVEDIAADEEEVETLKLPRVRHMQAVQPGETA